MSQNKHQSRPTRKKFTGLYLVLGLATSFIATISFILVLREFLRRLRARRPFAPPHEIELLPAPPPPVVPTPPAPEIPPVIEAPPIPFALPPAEVTVEVPPEEEVSFEIPVALIAPPPVVDVNTPIPPEVLIESGETFETADGKIILYQFNWQNPNLLKRIYPFRAEKLLDFLMYYSEIDLVSQFKSKGANDPATLARVEQSRSAILADRERVIKQLNDAIAAKELADPKGFGRIGGANHRSRRFRQTYFVDQEIQRARDKLDMIEDQREVYIKKVGWYPEDKTTVEELSKMTDPQRKALEAKRIHSAEQRKRWQSEADKSTEEINKIQAKINELKAFRKLFELEAELPGDELSVEDVMRWELRQKKEPWKNLEKEWQDDPLTLQNKLIKEIITWINRDPDRFPEWLVWMVIHFSGMRYVSAHSSYADPRYLLESLKQEDVEDRVKKLDSNGINLEANTVAQRLRRKAALNANLKMIYESLAARLLPPDRSVLMEVCRTEIQEDVKALKDESACLNALEGYRQELNDEALRTNDPKRAMPDWVWSEICKYTPLRLQTTDPNWEAFSPERYKWESNRWREVLATWESKDITSWRQKHRETLELVVTKAVCNEIAEHIQHMRGLTPAAGLTSKPVWYINQTKKDPRAYFKQAPAESDFKVGASIFWLEWVTTQPNAWQVARPLAGFSLAPNDPTPKQTQGKKVEQSKKAIEKEKEGSEGWNYSSPNNDYIRTRRLPSREDLRKQGLDVKKINEIMNERKSTGDFETQYLRWRHEATVVGVYDLVDGRYALTFETGQIGLRLRSLSGLARNPLIFVGYVPDRPLEATQDGKLVNMLRWDRILPGAGLPVRPRPKKINDPAAVGENVIKPALQQAEPTRPALVIRDEIKCFRIAAKDQHGRPKMEPTKPLVKLPFATIIEVSKTRKESSADKGDGLINTSQGVFVCIIKCEKVAFAEGTYVLFDETADLSKDRPVKWVTVNPSVDKEWIVCRVFKGKDAKGKPILEPVEDKTRRVLIPKGAIFRVSATHKESSMDKGDGFILPSSAPPHYLVLECEDEPDAEGFYVEAGEVSDSPPPVI